jgi:hypothetical protein
VVATLQKPFEKRGCLARHLTKIHGMDIVEAKKKAIEVGKKWKQEEESNKKEI